MSYTKGPWEIEGFAVKFGKRFDSVIAVCENVTEGSVFNNAHLISAAPDLLELLKKISKFGSAMLEEEIQQAIAKAEGK